MKTFFATVGLFFTSLFYNYTIIFILAMVFWLLYNWLIPIYFAMYLPIQFVHIPLFEFIGLLFLLTISLTFLKIFLRK